MTQDDDKNNQGSPESLHDQALRHYGQRFFAEAKDQSERDDAELDTWKKEKRGQRSWWPSFGGPAGKPDGDADDGGKD